MISSSILIELNLIIPCALSVGFLINSFLTFDLTSLHTRFVPIKKLSIPQQSPFVKLVDKILAIAKDNDYLENSEKQAKVRDYEKQIAQFVYKPYMPALRLRLAWQAGILIPEEIKIVEGDKS
ncbi:MAG: hypothetical protein G01um101429_898 [Parcubacteria group bacterium Gr01-1014_29]|nr:MAG: hypothetical protein G01um101429_898 [Parcubacteria group bacterium Gr01-1014_29]